MSLADHFWRICDEVTLNHNCVLLCNAQSENFSSYIGYVVSSFSLENSVAAPPQGTTLYLVAPCAVIRLK